MNRLKPIVLFCQNYDRTKNRTLFCSLQFDEFLNLNRLIAD